MRRTMRRAITRGAPALVLAAGCFSVPPYEPQTGLSYTESDAGGAVVAGRGTGVGFSSGGAPAGSGFSLRFADGPGFHFPDALMVDGTDAMGHEQPSVGCFREDEVGVLIAPTSRISAHGGAQVGKNVLSAAALRGPAVVQVKLEWGSAFLPLCSTTHSPGGTSTFTVFPDGKIVRSDTVADPVTSLINWSTCACAAPTISNDMVFRVFTYWTLARGFIKALYTPDPQAVPSAGEYNGIGNVDVSCVDSGSSQVTVAWPTTMDTWIRGGIDVIGFAHEQGGGPSELAAFDFKDRSAVFVSHDGCTAATLRAEQFLESLDPQSTIVRQVQIGDAKLSPSAIDGIYGGDSGSGEPGIELAGDSVDIAGPTPPGIAVWLRFPHPVEALRAVHSDSSAMGEWYLAQQVDKSSWIVWLRDQIPVNQKITISPR
jgi:hypothetical protein